MPVHRRDRLPLTICFGTGVSVSADRSPVLGPVMQRIVAPVEREGNFSWRRACHLDRTVKPPITLLKDRPYRRATSPQWLF
jgi:hypothetical protein